MCSASHLAGGGNGGSRHPCQLQHTPWVWSRFTAARHRKCKYRFLYPLKRPIFKFKKEEKVRHGCSCLHSLRWGAWERRTVMSSGLAWATERDPDSLFHFLPYKQIRAESPDLTRAFSGCFWAVCRWQCVISVLRTAVFRGTQNAAITHPFLHFLNIFPILSWGTSYLSEI